MVTYKHEMPLSFLRDDPAMGPALVQRLLKIDLPQYTSVKAASEALTTMNPAELTCDAVNVCYDSAGEAVAAVIVEVQLRRDRFKPGAWLSYLANQWRRHQVPTHVIVLCFDRATAAWAKTPLSIGHQDLVFAPWVIGPDEVPVTTESLAGSDALALTFLSALMHGHDPAHAATIIPILDHEFGGLPNDRAVEYASNALRILPEAARMVMEGIVKLEQFDYHRELLGDAANEIEARGEARGKADSLLLLLASRGLTLSESQTQSVRECTDLQRLDEWIKQAITAESPDFLDQ
ncbi:hypothetical protein [Natronoglycomyces albus]|uniref:Transposase (putative) YhgA-like domain-containing protein n=1 Tax=Natronoglycomyces albus TaxID=2811108 RepID=A0A895XPC9_9ACTN|nr:hypothetical protein [Natronoglycomyces albus]QSB04935.1 hypothetical protein JQS30_14390 [Natronoglycomyces albus]